MSAEQKGAKAGQKIDEVNAQSYRDMGRSVGAQLDSVAHKLNDKTADSTGKKADEHFYELYDSSYNLVSHGYQYAWSWVPFTKRQAKKAKNDPSGTAQEAKDNAQAKGNEMTNKAANFKDQEVDPTLGSLFNESRALVGSILDTASHYIAAADNKTMEQAEKAQNSDNKAVQTGGTYLASTRNVVASLVDRAHDIVTYGQEQAHEKKNMAQQKAGNMAGQAQNYGNAAAGKLQDAIGTGQQKAQQVGNKAQNTVQTGDSDRNRPGFSVSVNI